MDMSCRIAGVAGQGPDKENIFGAINESTIRGLSLHFVTILPISIKISYDNLELIKRHSRGNFDGRESVELGPIRDKLNKTKGGIVINYDVV